MIYLVPARREYFSDHQFPKQHTLTIIKLRSEGTLVEGTPGQDINSNNEKK